jgi:GDP-L-fucose synthase
MLKSNLFKSSTSDSSDRRVYVAGHRGMVGSAIVRALETRQRAGKPLEILTQTRHETDLTNRSAVQDFFNKAQPTAVILAAAKVGGIKANSAQPVEFLLENLKIQNNILEAAHDIGVQKLLFLGSSCIYPKLAPQPIREDSLLTGPLEPTNEWYAIAKIAGLKLAAAYRQQHGDDFISAMPTNLYGPGDNFDPETSHALPGMIYKFHHAKMAGADSVTLWGTGNSRREWLHADDAAEACVLLLDKYNDPAPINVGVGQDHTIKELAEMVRQAVGFEGGITWDTSQPDGTPRKLLDVQKLNSLGWKPNKNIMTGISEVYEWFVHNSAHARC